MLAASWGVKRVLLKASNGDDEARWSRNFNRGTIAPFLRRGIEVWAFGYAFRVVQRPCDGDVSAQG